MDRIALFADAAPAGLLKPRPFTSEAERRHFAERRLKPALGLRRIATEVPVDGWTTGRIEALAVDERLHPVVVEFKREATRNTIGQALEYLDWLLAHQDAVALRVARKLGLTRADLLDWGAPRLVCVAEAFGLREEAVAWQLGGRAELVRITRYSGGCTSSSGCS